MKILLNTLLMTSLALLTACQDKSATSTKTVTATKATVSNPFSGQMKALEDAKKIEQQLQNAFTQQNKQLEKALSQ